jgi:hypothetical protein
LQIDHAEFPLPLIQRAERVEKLLLAMKSNVAELLGPGLALKAVELLTVNLEGIANAGFPAEDGVKDVIEIAQVQGVRHAYEPDDHRVDIAENCTKNQSFEGCCRHPLSLTPTPDLVLDSLRCALKALETAHH